MMCELSKYAVHRWLEICQTHETCKSQPGSSGEPLKPEPQKIVQASNATSSAQENAGKTIKQPSGGKLVEVRPKVEVASQQIPYPYKKVYVLLLSWREPGFNKYGPEEWFWDRISKMEALFKFAYGFSTQRILIPMDKPRVAVEQTIADFFSKASARGPLEKTLLIVY